MSVARHSTPLLAGDGGTVLLAEQHLHQTVPYPAAIFQKEKAQDRHDEEIGQIPSGGAQSLAELRHHVQHLA
jgi:hypothetical protein